MQTNNVMFNSFSSPNYPYSQQYGNSNLFSQNNNFAGLLYGLFAIVALLGSMNNTNQNQASYNTGNLGNSNSNSILGTSPSSSNDVSSLTAQQVMDMGQGQFDQMVSSISGLPVTAIQAGPSLLNNVLAAGPKTAANCSQAEFLQMASGRSGLPLESFNINQNLLV